VIETVEPAQEASTHDEKATEPAVESTPEVTMGVQNPVYTPLTVQPAPATPVKRPAEFTIPPPPIAKRIKYIDTPVLAPPVFKCSPTSPSPTPSQLSSSDGMGSLLSTLRTRLTNAQKKTAGFREKQKQIDEELAPYQAKIAEEMAQIEKKLEIEEADAEEAENTFMASVQMLAEFKKGGTDS
jgi:hypothetical protein